MIVVHKQPLIDKLIVVGMIEPGNVTNIFSPFDGEVQQKYFVYGDKIENGKPLLDMDTTEIETKIREAQVVLMKASHALHDLETWNAGPEASHAKRNVVTSQLGFDDAKQKLEETQNLLLRGIIARMEYDAANQQFKNQELQLAAAREDLNATLKKGGAESLKITQLELQNARQKVEDLTKSVRKKTLYAGISGVVLPAQSVGGQAETLSIDVGSRLTKGQNIFKIVDLDTSLVKASVDEIDVNQLQEGQLVEVTGESFSNVPIRAEIKSIAFQSQSAEGASKAASFGITIQMLGLTPEQRKTIRAGMSAKLSIIRYQNPDAIVIPAAAVHQEQDQMFVFVKKSDKRKWQKTKVVLGMTTESGIEILQGIKEGEFVAVDGSLLAPTEY